MQRDSGGTAGRQAYMPHWWFGGGGDCGEPSKYVLTNTHEAFRVFSH